MKRKSQAQSRGGITRNITAGEISMRFQGFLGIFLDIFGILGSIRYIIAGENSLSYLGFVWNLFGICLGFVGICSFKI